MPRDAFVLKIQTEWCHPKCARKVSGLLRNGPQIWQMVSDHREQKVRIWVSKVTFSKWQNPNRLREAGATIFHFDNQSFHYSVFAFGSYITSVLFQVERGIRFLGQSYAEVATGQQNITSFSFAFKTLHPSGLLLYNGEVKWTLFHFFFLPFWLLKFPSYLILNAE